MSATLAGWAEASSEGVKVSGVEGHGACRLIKDASAWCQGLRVAPLLIFFLIEMIVRTKIIQEDSFPGFDLKFFWGHHWHRDSSGLRIHVFKVTQ